MRLLITTVISLLLGAYLPCLALAAEVEVVLTGGEVVGKQRGRGTATVQAEVHNLGVRRLEGIVIACYYSIVDAQPGENASWRNHEFVFNPPLLPGRKASISFTDEDAAEYVLLEVRQAVFNEGLSYNGEIAKLSYGLSVIDSVTYIAVRDLVSIVGGSINFDNDTQEIVLKREVHELRFSAGSKTVAANNTPTELASAVLVHDGRSFVPLLEFAELLGISAEVNPELGLILLSDE